jgi:hypothetical protein
MRNCRLQPAKSYFCPTRLLVETEVVVMMMVVMAVYNHHNLRLRRIR